MRSLVQNFNAVLFDYLLSSTVFIFEIDTESAAPFRRWFSIFITLILIFATSLEISMRFVNQRMV